MELASKYLLKQNIEFTDKLVIIKMIMTWFVAPFVLIIYYNNTMLSKVMDYPERVAAVSWNNSLALFVLFFCFILRVGVFVFFQDRVETPLNSGMVVVEYENLAPNRIKYYQSINQFWYKRIE